MKIRSQQELLDGKTNEIQRNQYIVINTINSTATSIIQKIYDFKEKKFFIKKIRRRTYERRKLDFREKYNYNKVHHFYYNIILIKMEEKVKAMKE